MAAMCQERGWDELASGHYLDYSGTQPLTRRRDAVLGLVRDLDREAGLHRHESLAPDALNPTLAHSRNGSAGPSVLENMLNRWVGAGAMAAMCEDRGPRCEVEGFGFRVYGPGCRVYEGLGVRV